MKLSDTKMFMASALQPVEVFTGKTSVSDNGCYVYYSKRKQAVPFLVRSLSVGKGIRQQYHGQPVSYAQSSSLFSSFPFQFIDPRAEAGADVQHRAEQCRQFLELGDRGRTLPRIAVG